MVLERFLENLKRLAQPDQKLVLAISGGKDSMALFHLLIAGKIPFIAGHCNFGLRGEESDADESFVKISAEQNGIPFFSIRFNTKEFADEKGLSIQEAARELRYDWLKRLAKEQHCDLIATAHHLDDSIETFFINLMRNSGPAGLSGIPEQNGTIIRPLLSFTSDEIKDYITKNHLVFREDRSNLTDDYLRNRIRHHLLPPLKDGSFYDDMKSILADFKVISDYFEEKAEDWLKRHCPDRILLPLKQIKSDDRPEELLSLLLHHLGIHGTEVRKILRAETGKMFDAAHCRLLIDREKLMILPKVDQEIAVQEVSELPYRLQMDDIAFEINLSQDVTVPENYKVMKVDAAKLHFPLQIRPWREGDRFMPLGMDGMKKISDFLTDEKVNRFVKDKVCVLLSDTDIVCILGHRIDHRFRITADTQNTLTITQK